MLNIGNKTFMNLQEAVGWLLENNALPFQSTANYVGNTEIAMSTLINPSPAKVRVGSLIFFADSKVSTVVGVTSNSFIVSDQYNDLVDDVVYVSNVALNASGHLIVTLSNGNTIDAGLIKQVTGFSIDGSQHLIVSYNDGSTTDLGPIFSGDITVSGNLSVTGDISGNSIIENMSGYSWVGDSAGKWTPIYIGSVKNGNKLTFVVFGKFTPDNDLITAGFLNLGSFMIPYSVGAKLFPYTLSGINNILDFKEISAVSTLSNLVTIKQLFQKNAGNDVRTQIRGFSNLTAGTEYLFRLEVTFLLSNNLAS